MAKLFVCGDIVNDHNNKNFVGAELQRFINSTDYAVANLEGVETPSGQYLGNGPFQVSGTIDYLKRVGFNLMLLANNHITDGGKDLLKYTLNTLDSYGIDRIGAGTSWKEAYKPLVKEIAGVKIAFFNICEAQVGHYVTKSQEFGYAWVGYKDLYKDISDIKKFVDRIVFFVHMGLEHYDMPLPEVREFYRNLCNAGVSCVIGGHPHIAQGYEFYHDSLIVYSLGNFFFPKRDRWPNEVYSYSAILDIAKEGRIGISPIVHYNNGELVELSRKGSIDIDELNNKLGACYDDLIRDVINQAYNHLCKYLIAEATCGQNDADDIKQIVKKALHYSIFRKKYFYNTIQRRQKLLLRLFENETYRYVIINYLKSVI